MFPNLVFIIRPSRSPICSFIDQSNGLPDSHHYICLSLQHYLLGLISVFNMYLGVISLKSSFYFSRYVTWKKRELEGYDKENSVSICLFIWHVMAQCQEVSVFYHSCYHDLLPFRSATILLSLLHHLFSMTSTALPSTHETPRKYQCIEVSWPAPSANHTSTAVASP